MSAWGRGYRPHLLVGHSMAKALVILQKAVLVLKDPEYVRWKKEELLDWISEAQVAIARTPGAYSVTKVIPLVEGTRQTLPEDAWSLVTVSRNFEDDLETPLYPIRLVTRSLLDLSVPDWHMRPGRPIVENYVYDERYPNVFFVFPPNDGTGHAEVVYQGIPAPVTSEEEDLSLDDSFVPAILSYVLYRAFSKDSDYAPGVQSAASYFSAYNSELTNAIQARGMTTPNASLAPAPVAETGGTE